MKIDVFELPPWAVVDLHLTATLMGIAFYIKSYLQHFVPKPRVVPVATGARTWPCAPIAYLYVPLTYRISSCCCRSNRFGVN